MILVDTSVWIRFLSNRSPWAEGLDELLERGEVAAHDLIHGELLIGDAGGRERLLADYALLARASNATHDEVVDFVRERGLHGRGIGWIDAHLLASAFLDRLLLWTADRPLSDIARQLGVSYEIR